MNVLTKLLEYKIVAIIRGVPPADVLPVVKALYKGGIYAVEVTLNSVDALQMIREVSDKMGDKMLVGAGTVLDAAAAVMAIDAGAQFIIAPSVDVETIRVTKEQGKVSIPGAFTATEIVTAYRAGADLVKVFPASSPQYIKDLKGPLNHIPMMPTGGVNLQSIKAFHSAGAVAFGIGSALVDTGKKVTEVYLNELSQKAAAFATALNHA